MKIKRINTAFLLLALAGMILTGCSNEDLANVTPQEEGAGNVSFSIVEKDYEPADNTPKSRAAIEETKPEIQDLGNGLIAEVSLVPDTTHRVENPKTRAINTPTHYTIQAFQGGVKKGELKGTFNGSTFTPDPGQPEAIGLPHGTYDFVCFNDGVTSNGTKLTVNLIDAATARFDVQRNVVINQDPKQQIKFTMKHAGARVLVLAEYRNFAITSKMTSTQYIDELGMALYKGQFDNPLEKFKYNFGTSANDAPSTMVYDVATNSYSYPTMGQVSVSGEAETGWPVAGGGTPGMTFGNQSSFFKSVYVLPTTDVAKLKVTFTYGELYGNSLVGKSITIPNHKQVEANKRYMVEVRVYMTNQYLYSDGTSGSLDKNTGKTPIAVIYDLVQRRAIALHDVNKGGSDQIQWSNTTSQESSDPVTNYQTLLGGAWEGNVSAMNTAIQAARDYVPNTPPLFWYISPVFEFDNMGDLLGRMLESGNSIELYSRNNGTYKFLIPSGAAATGFTTPAPSTINFPAMDMTRFNNAFTKVGGTPPSGTYWINTECKDGTEYKQATITISGGKYHLGLKSKTETAKIRPFTSY